MDISKIHQESKKDSYWSNLTSGNTSQYKEQKIGELLKKHFGDNFPNSILDIGCGTCDIAFRYKDIYGSSNITCLDYDEKVLQRLKEVYPDPTVEWRCADVFELEKNSNAKFDLIFLLDMVHEIYSFYGRPGRDLSLPIDHKLGKQFVAQLLDNVCAVTADSGAIVITDNVLCEENVPVRIATTSHEVADAVKYFFANYPSRKIEHTWISDDTFELNSKDLCVLLTQYNKIKSKNWDRWNVEKMEIHQYFTEREYEDYFHSRGFKAQIIIGMPDDAKLEWTEDFKIISGMKALPDKRVTLLATKSAQ